MRTASEVAGIDVDALPPTQYLVMEVLTARYRTGESCWTFPSRPTPAMRALEDIGAVRWKSGVVQNTVLVWLTDTGRDSVLDPNYEPPSERAASAFLPQGVGTWST